MSKTALSLVIVAVTVLCATAFGRFAVDIVRPALAANTLNGKRLAKLWCAACHVVTINQREANADAPPFEDAERLGFSEPSLEDFCLILTPRCRA